MKLVRSTFLSLATLAVVFIALLAGCSGSDPLSTTVGQLVLDFQITDPGSTQYEEGGLQLITATLLPVSTEALESLGGAGIALLSNKRLVIDMNTTSNPIPAANIPAGAYVLDKISFYPVGFAPIELVDHDLPDPAAACIDRKTMLPGTDLEKSLVATKFNVLSEEQRTLRPGVPVSIRSGEVVSLPIRINSALLIQAYKNAMVCSDSVAVCQAVAGTTPPCLARFDMILYLDEITGLDWIDFGPQ